MADEVIDIEALLAPLPAGEGGVGEDLRSDFSTGSPYQRLRDARSDARAEERAMETGEDDAAVPQPWRDVKRLACECLATRTKDLEIAAWLAEALVRLDGLPGLTAAARVIDGLAERYWEHGFPQPDEDGMEVRSAPLGGLAGESADGTIMQPLRRIPMFLRADGKPVGLHLWQSAEETAALGDKKRKDARLAAGVPDLSVLENEARADSQRLRGIAKAARTAQRAWTAMDARLNERFGADAPSTRRVTEALERIFAIGERMLGVIPDDLPSPSDDATDAEETPAGDAVAGAVAGGAAGPRPLRTRDDAIRQLEELADWFRRTEPHSPMAYTLDDAVRRARLPLPDLLAEVLPDEKARAAMLTMLGIRNLAAPPAA